MKRNDMPICDRPIKVWGEGGGRRFQARMLAKTNPMELSYALSITSRDSGPNKPNSVNFLSIYRLQPKSARFFGKYECGDPDDPLRIPS
jgi:hypothetical protein